MPNTNLKSIFTHLEPDWDTFRIVFRRVVTYDESDRDVNIDNPRVEVTVLKGKDALEHPLMNKPLRTHGIFQMAFWWSPPCSYDWDGMNENAVYVDEDDDHIPFFIADDKDKLYIISNYDGWARVIAYQKDILKYASEDPHVFFPIAGGG